MNKKTTKSTCSYSSLLSELSRQAFDEVKERLGAIGGSFVLPRTMTLQIDTCGSDQYLDSLYELEAKKVVLHNNYILILADIAPEREKEILEGSEDETPEESWIEGSSWYAELEGLFEVFDLLLEMTDGTT